MREWSHKVLVSMLRRLKIAFNVHMLRSLPDSSWNELGDWCYVACSGDKDHVRDRPEPAALPLIRMFAEADQTNCHGPRRKIIERIKEIFDV